MDFTKVIGVMSLVGCIITLVVVATGQQQEVRTMIAPDADSSGQRSKVFSDSVIGTTQVKNKVFDLEHLMTAAQAATVGQTSVEDPGALRRELQEREPHAGLGETVKMSIHDQGKVLIFCAKPNFYSVCAGMNLTSRAESTSRASGPAKKARAKLLRQLRGR